MGISTWTFSETTPSAAGTAVSVNAITGEDGMGTAGILSSPALTNADVIRVKANLIGATGGTLDVYVQTSCNEGATWDDQVHFAQLGAGAGAVIQVCSIAKGALTPTTIGSGTSPALAAGTAVQGTWGSQWRLLFVAGTSTSAGAAIKVTVSALREDTRRNG